MGYTHYWDRPKTFDVVTFREFMQVNRVLLDRLPRSTASAGGYYEEEPLVLCGPDGTGSPEIAEEGICFNGQWRDDSAAPDLSHEALDIPRVMAPCAGLHGEHGLNLDLCETARKPYDLAVCAVLLNLKHYFPLVRVSSDGRAREWAEAARYYQAVTERDLPFAGPWSKLEEDR